MILSTSTLSFNVLLERQGNMTPPTTNPFTVGSQVIWSEKAPKSWHFIWTPGPMVVISSRWDDGHPSEYSQKFGGVPREPGWIITVEYDADSTDYYDPPLSSLLGKKKLQEEIHQRWLSLI